MQRRTFGSLLTFFTFAIGHSSHEGVLLLRIIELLAEGHGVANTVWYIATRAHAVGVVVITRIVVHLLRVLFEANHREACVVAGSRRFAAIEMPDAPIIGVGFGRWISTLHSKGVCKLPLERRDDGKNKVFHSTS